MKRFSFDPSSHAVTFATPRARCARNPEGSGLGRHVRAFGERCIGAD